MTDFKKLKVIELRAELAQRNLTQTGKRDELIERLEEYEFHHAMPIDSESGNDSTTGTSDESVEIMEDSHSSISPVLPPSPIPAPEIASSPTAEEIEEEKRLQRALRFGIDPTPTVKIEFAIKRLEHALPNRRNKGRYHHKHRDSSHRQVTINKP